MFGELATSRHLSSCAPWPLSVSQLSSARRTPQYLLVQVYLRPAYYDMTIGCFLQHLGSIDLLCILLYFYRPPMFMSPLHAMPKPVTPRKPTTPQTLVSTLTALILATKILLCSCMFGHILCSYPPRRGGGRPRGRSLPRKSRNRIRKPADTNGLQTEASLQHTLYSPEITRREGREIESKQR